MFGFDSYHTSSLKGGQTLLRRVCLPVRLYQFA